MRAYRLFSLLLVTAAIGCQTGKQIAPEIVHRPAGVAVPAPHSIVATDAPLATEVGAEVLRRGGNAADATVATAFALAVVHPVAGNIGGGGFIVARLAQGEAVALDFRETAPRNATRDMFLDRHGKPTDRSTIGHLASGTPGAVAGLWEFHRRYGVLPWSELLAPSIRLAEQGFVVDSTFAATVREDSARLALFPASAALFLPGHRPLAPGALWKNPDLGATLRRIAAHGRDGFYAGETARLLLTEMARGKGILTAGDLAAYQPVWREPLRISYRGHVLLSMPPPSSGGVTLALIANMMEPFDLRERGWHAPASLHYMIEVLRRAFADRNAYLADPDAVPVPTARLLSLEYAAARRSDIDTAHATPSRLIGPGPIAPRYESMQTTHFSLADDRGNVVSMTTTINLGYGSAVTVAGAGFLLNNEMDDFTAKPGTANTFGLVQGEANVVAPGKRVLSSMAPTIVLDPHGEVLLVTGASGGPRIITTVFQIISNIIDYHRDLASAVNAPRIHHQHLPDVVLTEPGALTAAERADLVRRGHVLQEAHRLGIAASVLRTADGWMGMADPRIRGLALGH
jgi:gamma-glutamyltranspeptidase/glutathione hydrolase